MEYLTLNIYGSNYNKGLFYYCPECHTAGLGHVDKCPTCNSQKIYNEEFNNEKIKLLDGNYLFQISDGTYHLFDGKHSNIELTKGLKTSNEIVKLYEMQGIHVSESLIRRRINSYCEREKQGFKPNYGKSGRLKAEE